METLRYLRSTGFDWSWFILDLPTLKKEFALSGSEQNPDLTGKSWLGVVRNRLLGPAAPVRAFLERGKDFLVAQDLSELMRKMEALAPGVLDPGRLEREVKARDRELLNPFAKDGQVLMVHAFRRYVGDRLFRVAKPHPFLSGKGPLVAVRLWTLTRKTLGGIQTDLKGRALKPLGEPLPGLFAAGAVSYTHLTLPTKRIV